MTSPISGCLLKVRWRCLRVTQNPLHRLGMKNNEEVAASAFDTIGTALYDLRERIAEMQKSHLSETIRQSYGESSYRP